MNRTTLKPQKKKKGLKMRMRDEKGVNNG